MAISTAVVNGTTPTTTGTKSFTSSGFGTPQAAIITISGASTTSNPYAGVKLGIGFTDCGTNENYCTVASIDAAGTSATRRTQNTNACISVTTSGGTILVVGVFSATTTDGITINFTTVDSVAYNISVTLIKGCTNIVAGSKALPSAGVTTISGLGFKPNLAYIASTGYSALGSSTHCLLSVGAAHNSSTDVVTQGCSIVHSNEAQATEDASTITRNDACCGQMLSGTQSWKGSAENFVSGGFDINTGADNPAGDYIFYLAMDTGDTNGVSIDIVDSPTATGTWSITAPGFQPQHVLLGLSSCATTNTAITADPISYGLGMFDATIEGCAGIDFDDAAATMDVQSNFSSSSAVELYHYSGGHTQFAVGSFSSFGASGYSLSFPTYVNGTTRRWLSVAIDSGAGAGGGTSVVSLAGEGGLAGYGGLAGQGGGLAG